MGKGFVMMVVLGLYIIGIYAGFAERGKRCGFEAAWWQVAVASVLLSIASPVALGYGVAGGDPSKCPEPRP